MQHPLQVRKADDRLIIESNDLVASLESSAMRDRIRDDFVYCSTRVYVQYQSEDLWMRVREQQIHREGFCFALAQRERFLRFANLMAMNAILDGDVC